MRTILRRAAELPLLMALALLTVSTLFLRDSIAGSRRNRLENYLMTEATR